jgi:hypothetical protein
MVHDLAAVVEEICNGDEAGLVVVVAEGAGHDGAVAELKLFVQHFLLNSCELLPFL